MKPKFRIKDYKENIDFTKYENLSIKNAIHAKCLECCAWQPSEVKLCDIKTCALWQFKENGFKVRKISENTKKTLQDNATRMRRYGLKNH